MLLSCSVHAVVSGELTEEEYIKGYFSIYSSYITGNETTKSELMDVIAYYLSSDDLAGNLYYVGPNSNKMIGSILADSGIVFDCGPCNYATLNQRCCIYRMGDVPRAYDCIGSEVVGISNYGWEEIWQCTYGCCKNKCCLSLDDTTTRIVSTSALTTTTYPVSTTVTTAPVSTTTTLAPSTTNPATTTTIASTTTTTSSSTTTTLAAGPRITILYLPVDWTDTAAAFNSIVDNQVAYLVSHIPLKACPSEVKAIRINSSCTVNVPTDWDTCYASAGRILAAIGSCARATGQKYDYVIGISNETLCAGRGFTSYSAPYVYIAGDEPRKTTHELGHQWGLGDEYYDTCRCFLTQFPQCTHNCLDSSLGGGDPVPGYTTQYCVNGTICPSQIGTSTCFGNKNRLNTRCIMGTDYAGTTRDFCKHCSDYLATLSLLKC